MTLEELETSITNCRQELFSLRFRLSTGQLEETNKIRALKKDIARALTVMGQATGVPNEG